MRIILRTILLLLITSFTNTFAQVSPPNTSLVAVPVVVQDAEVDIDFAIIDFNETPVTGGASSFIEAGLAFSGGGNTMWVNYTYRQNGNSPSTASIDVEVSGLDPSVTFTLVPMLKAGTATGTMISGNQVLSNGTFSNFITGITEGFSGDGIGNGFQVSYLIDNPNNADLSGITVAYIIKY
ncbi:hypothetical protein [Tenacibaculum haliotis]|uniref:hypothetical protein n=1 Tax=Tenacibaculum haliotis TaxID=1888914 RepID=UPI0021AE9DED|nr:hypothetical protein [Tenacibaculum haliotis]MCT4700001.1 hypothetical protein [Tenacibaculum haliotis]